MGADVLALKTEGQGIILQFLATRKTLGKNLKIHKLYLPIVVSRLAPVVNLTCIFTS